MVVREGQFKIVISLEILLLSSKKLELRCRNIWWHHPAPRPRPPVSQWAVINVFISNWPLPASLYSRPSCPDPGPEQRWRSMWCVLCCCILLLLLLLYRVSKNTNNTHSVSAKTWTGSLHLIIGVEPGAQSRWVRTRWKRKK